MAISREKKEAIVSEYTEKISRSQALILTEYRGLTVKQLEALRRDLRGCDSEIMISKNTLLARALGNAGLPAPASLLSGPTAITFCFGEPSAPAKTLSKWAKDTKILVLRGGILGSTIFDGAGVEALSQLPGREQLRAQVVGMLQAPLSSLVNVLAGPMRGFLTVLNARMGQLEQAA